MQTETFTKSSTLQKAANMILKEHQQLFTTINYEQLAAIVPVLDNANSIFVIGAGRTGFMVKAAAMRLMHLGYRIHVVGETTTPAITKGDVLIAASGSGTTSGIVKAAETAAKNQATVIAFTTNSTSTLATIANHIVHIPAAGKQEANQEVSAQYAGSLFEQSFLIAFDALIHFMWKENNYTTEELWSRHANME